MRSFQLVEDKVLEAEFFLGKIAECGLNFVAARCYASAFASSARSVTFALQAALRHVRGFNRWYNGKQSQLREDPLARFFQQFRTVSQHIGDNPVVAGIGGPGQDARYYFISTGDLPDVPTDDVLTACHRYFCILLGLVYECYLEYGPDIDPHQYFTAENFERLGKTIEDAEEELGFPRGWTDIGDVQATTYRWQVLRDSTGGCQVRRLFERYLAKTLPEPERLPPYTRKGEDGSNKRMQRTP